MNRQHDSQTQLELMTLALGHQSSECALQNLRISHRIVIVVILVVMGTLNLQDRKMTEKEISGGGIAGLEYDGQKGRGGKCRTGK